MEKDKKTAVCSRCGRRIILSSNSFINENGIYSHKKCVGRLNDDEKKDYKSLKNKIQWYIDTQNKNIHVKSFNWFNINSKIKELRADGYTYKEIEYALDVVVRQMDGFYGFGAVVNRIYPIIEKKRKKDFIIKTPVPPQIDIVYKVKTDEIDF